MSLVDLRILVIQLFYQISNMYFKEKKIPFLLDFLLIKLWIHLTESLTLAAITMVVSNF